MEIEVAKIDDLEEIYRISKCYFDWNENQFKEYINNKDIFLKAQVNNEVMGFLIAQNLIDSFNLLLIAIKDEFKNKNIATKLIQKMEEIIKRKSINNIWLEVRESNIPAIKLYKKNNFKSIYIRRNYYHNGENAIVYEKMID